MVVLEDGSEVILVQEVKTLNDYIKWRSQYTFYGKVGLRQYDGLCREK